MAFVKHVPRTKPIHNLGAFVRFDDKGGAYLSSEFTKKLKHGSVVDLYWDSTTEILGIKHGTTYKVTCSRGKKGKSSMPGRIQAPSFVEDTSVPTKTRIPVSYDPTWTGWLSNKV